MRIRQLSFDFFGRFTGKMLDFGPADRGADFHVIYGPNEAGKTTTMEGYLRLLYGFPLREPYAFQHQRQNLRISGLLEIDGVARQLTRLPTRGANLRGEAGATLPEAAIAAHLGGLSQDDYRSLLCLDDATIETGGEDIASARGDIGRLLFSAAAGVSDLNAVLDQAQAEAGQLYRKRASSTRVAELKRDLAETERQIRDLDVSAAAWRKLKDVAQTTGTAEAQARAARDRLRMDQATTAALSRALPWLAEADRLRARIAGCEDHPDHLDIDPEELVTLKTDHDRCRAERDRLTAEIARAEAERHGLVPDAERAALSEQLDDLDLARSRMATAALDLPRRRAALDEAGADMARLARDLGAPEGCDPTALVLPLDRIAALEACRDARRQASDARQAAADEVDRLTARLAEVQRDLTALQGAAPAQTGLAGVLARFDADGLSPAVAAARQAIALATEAASDALEALSLGDRVFTRLPDCPIDPGSAATIAADHAALTDRIARTDEALAAHQGDVAVWSARMAQLADSTALASDAAARQARAARDALWQAHRDRLSADSADAFAPAMAQVDQIEAARLAHAQELGQLRQLAQSRAEAEARAATAQAQLAALRQQAAATEARVAQMTAAMGLPALSPGAFREWVALQAEAAAAARRCARLARQHHQTLEQADRLLAALGPHLTLERPGFDAALTAARRLAEEERRHHETTAAARAAQAGLQADLDRRRARLAALTGAEAQAHADWTAMVTGLFGTLVSPETLGSALEQLRQIREIDLLRLQVGRQVGAMEEDQRRFAQAVTALNAGLALPASDPTELFARLRALADQARADQTRHQALSVKIDGDRAALADLDRRLSEIDRQVAALGALLPGTSDRDTLDALRDRVTRCHDVIRTRAGIAALDAQICDSLSVPGIAEARPLLEATTSAGLEARAAALEADLGQADAQLSEATAARAHAERDLAAVSGGAEIARLVERRATLHLQLEETVLDYMERDLGLRLALEAIRRYRDAHRSTMMQATERAFAQLTNGAYPRLDTQADGASDILLAVDAQGVAKQVGDMSKGTRFQLYLALRAAAYEQMVAQGVQLPFFCDDVFETFDEDRTRAACRLMERIGRSGQAIYLTHHRHVVDLAMEVCDVPPILHEI